MRILIVDDNPAMRLLLVEVLRVAHYETITATNGLEALARLRDDTGIGLMLVDGRMPLCDGPTFLRRAGPGHPPAIGLSAEYGPALLAAGAVENVDKPFALPDLLAAIARAGA